MVAFFRSAKVSPETTVRVANINEPGHGDHRGYSGNFMRTAKYTYLNFLFKFFWNFVLRRVAYLYFILISVLQIGTDFSPTGKLTTVGPLSVIILFSMINEFWQDQRRRKADREVNARPSRVLRGGSFVPVKWQDVRVGDVVEVRDGEEFPADLLLISTAKPQGLCYVETSNLDGETNLKIRKAPDATKHLQTAEAVAAMVGRVDYEGPNNRLYVFEGTLSLESGAASGAPTKVPLDVNSVLLRGAQFRNTPFCYGVVLYAGADTKLARNSMQVPFKKSQVEKTINRCMILLFLTLVMLIVASSIMLAVNQRNEDDWYVGADDETTKAFNWIVFLILYNSIVPISLYLGIEMSRGGQAALMEADLGMYWAKTDTPMQFKTSTLNEELGQVEYIFSDKTGTLTQNVMEFKKCSVAGVVYQEAGSLDELPAATEGAEWMSITSRIKGKTANGESDPVEDFLKILVACHTVIPEMMPDGKIVYQAASPDEGALVDAVKQMGFEFKARTNTSIMYIVGGKEERELEVHAGRVSDTQGASLTHNRSPRSSPRSSLSTGARDQRILVGAEEDVDPRPREGGRRLARPVHAALEGRRRRHVREVTPRRRQVGRGRRDAPPRPLRLARPPHPRVGEEDPDRRQGGRVARAVPRRRHRDVEPRRRARGGGERDRAQPRFGRRDGGRGQAAGGGARDDLDAPAREDQGVDADGRQAGDGDQHRLRVEAAHRLDAGLDDLRHRLAREHAQGDGGAVLRGAVVARAALEQPREEARARDRDRRKCAPLLRRRQGAPPPLPLDGGRLHRRRRLPRLADAEGRHRPAGEGEHGAAADHPRDRRRRQRRLDDPGGAHRHRRVGQRGDAGGAECRLRDRPVRLPAAAAARPRVLELLPDLPAHPVRWDASRTWRLTRTPHSFPELSPPAPPSTGTRCTNRGSSRSRSSSTTCTTANRGRRSSTTS